MPRVLRACTLSAQIFVPSALAATRAWPELLAATHGKCAGASAAAATSRAQPVPPFLAARFVERVHLAAASRASSCARCVARAALGTLTCSDWCKRPEAHACCGAGECCGVGERRERRAPAGGRPHAQQCLSGNWKPSPPLHACPMAKAPATQCPSAQLQAAAAPST